MNAGTEPSPIFRRLQPGAGVGLRAEACLPLRSRYSDCNRCVEACPVGALHRDAGRFALDASCVGCGRCAAVCPMGALAVPGFSVDTVAAPRAEALAVDCRRVPAADSPAGAVRVPCLGGLSVSRLLALTLSAENRGLALLDRGWCARCAAGGGAAHPAQDALSQARVLLRAVGVADADLPELASRPLSPEAAAPAIPGPEEEGRLSRRTFLGQLARQATTAVSEALADAPEPLSACAVPAPQRGRQGHAQAGRTTPQGAGLRAPQPSLERARLLAVLDRLAARNGREPPAALFPAVEMTSACRDHELCARLCPTGALHVYATEGARGVGFEPARCIACGACERLCPERAIRFHPQGRGGRPEDAAALTRHARRLCAECGVEFSAAGEATLCGACRKSRALVKAGYDLRFRAGVE